MPYFLYISSASKSQPIVRSSRASSMVSLYMDPVYALYTNVNQHILEKAHQVDLR